MTDKEFWEKFEADEDGQEMICEMALRSDCNSKKNDDGSVWVSDRYSPYDSAKVYTVKEFISFAKSVG